MNFLLLNHAIALFLTSATAFLVGLFIFSKSEFEKTKLANSLWYLSVAGWSFFLGMFIISPEPPKFVLSLMWAFTLFIPVSTAHFVISFLGIKGKNWFIGIGYVLAFIFAGISFTKKISLSYFSFAYLNHFPKANFLIYIQAFLFFIYFFYQIIQLYKAYSFSTGIKRNQIAYVFWASLLGYLGGGSNYLLVFGKYVPIFNPFATYFLLFYTILTPLAILKYQLMDIRVVIKKALFYSIGIAMASAGIVGVSFLNDWFYKNAPELKFWTVPLVAGAAAFVLGRLFWNKSREVDKLKYEFITVAAHKLRTPLTEVKWGVEALKDGKISEEEKKELFLKVQDANNRTIQLTDELLSVAKVENDQTQYKLEADDLEKIAREIINDFQRRMKEKNIKLSYKYEKNLSPVNVDKIRIGSVIQTLLENAIDYTKDEINIFIDTYKNNVIFHIEDNGIGIKKEDQPYIFSKFYRSHEAYLTETEGTGIGLFLAKSIIDKHNGKIGVRSSGSGQGSIFWFSLPIA